ncbi:hypothetical protein UPYG_G00096340 [Umbra pygmaea]|uniref:Secreted protein n=1 Tax=Umbra pygmaea TaxID=75934 RepID=A0ABD0X3W4_UMBPY
MRPSIGIAGWFAVLSFLQLTAAIRVLVLFHCSASETEPVNRVGNEILEPDGRILNPGNTSLPTQNNYQVETWKEPDGTSTGRQQNDPPPQYNSLFP